MRSIRRQHGIVLFIALIAMVILSLAGVGMMRSVDTGTNVVRNLTFRQASIAPVNHAMETAIDAIFKSKLIGNLNADDPVHRYYATLQPGEHANGVPAILSGTYPPIAYDSTFGPAVPDPVGLEVRSVIERVCNNLPGTLIDRCDLQPPKQAPGGTDNKFFPPPIPPIPLYRVTVRVDWPNTNAVSYAQAFLR